MHIDPTSLDWGVREPIVALGQRDPRSQDRHWFLIQFGRYSRFVSHAPNLRVGRKTKFADQVARLEVEIFDELGYPPFTQPGSRHLFYLAVRIYELVMVFLTVNFVRGE
jgi:hypothetical protein